MFGTAIKSDKRLRRVARRDQRGQSTLEFAFAMVFVVGFSLFFFQLCVLFAFGNYVHYATFMAARAYLSGGKDLGEQQDRARSVIAQTLKFSEAQMGVDRFGTIAKAEGGSDLTGMDFNIQDYAPENRTYSWGQGIRYTFRGRLIVLPLLAPRNGNPRSINSVLLQSESFLGRETSFEECVSEMARRKGGIFDNGC